MVHFGETLKEHIARCKECKAENYVDYEYMKDLIYKGASAREFQEAYHTELHKVSSGLSTSAAQVDPKYLKINRTALDKITKKFDKVRKAKLRGLNREVANETLRLGLQTLPIDELPLLDDDLVDGAEHAAAPKLSSSMVFTAGAISGIISRTSTAPFDRVKILLQADPSKNSGKPRIPHGSGSIRAACHLVYKDAGIRGFWRGNLANVLKVTPESATKFYLYDLTTGTLFRGKEQLALTDRFTAGCIAGALSQLVVYPLDVTKTRLAASRSGQYRGIWDCISSTVRHEGFMALYKGVRPAVAAIVPAAGVDLAVYNTLREQYCDWREDRFKRELEQRTLDILQEPTRNDIELPKAPSPSPPIAWTLAFGAMSATSGAVVAYPLTLIRTKLIAQGMPGHPVQYTGALDCARQIYQIGGVKAMYRGIAPALMKAVPAVSIGYGAFEAAKILLQHTSLSA
eukprot:m.122183 g.122183  ORF g.122183 m.122183 type:complete len:458 (+) comp11098_c0_seq2:535-1908(+)